ncbi:MAG TPA: ABC transporter substrate-binding protein [Roseiarcus sp.]|nr:ABC transporter substrate-binding protein [Roseiarcus sp.]
MIKFHYERRAFLKTGAAALAATALPRIAFAAPKTIKIGLVAPQTGPLAIFSEQLPWTLEQIKAVTGGQIAIGGMKHPLEIVARDSQSNPNRAAEVAKNLILQEKVDLVTTFATPETVNPVADQCEVSGVPCLSNDCPLEPYFFGRQGDPKKGFDWTYNYFFSAVNLADAYYDSWDQVPTNKVVGALWPNDNDGQAFSKIFTGMAAKRGYKIVDPGRFDLPSGNYSAQIAAFKTAGAEIIAGVLPPPEFTAFASAAAQQNFQPKVVAMAKATEFPAAIAPLGPRAEGLSVEVWWSPTHPFKSGLTGQSSQELADAYQKATGKPASMTLGFRHALFETAIDALKRAQNLDDPDSIRDAIAKTDYASIVGPVNFTKGPYPNCCQTPLVIGQWKKGTTFPFDLVNVDNTTAPNIPVGGKMTPIANA